MDDKHASVEDIKHYDFDVALSYASEDGGFVDVLAAALQCEGVKVFYDKYEKAALWGQDLYTYLSDIYQNKARYCVMFLSRQYAAKLWTNHERQAAQARAFKEQSAYILPIRLDDTVIPGILPTIAYLTYHQETVEDIAHVILEKLEDLSRKSLQQWQRECEDYWDAGYAEKALIACKRAMAIDPYDWFSYYKMSWILVQLKRFEEALTYAEQGIKCDPTDCEDIIYNVKCDALVGLKRYGEALAVYKHRLKQMHPYHTKSYMLHGYIGALCGKADVLFELKRYDEAFATYEEAIQLDSGDVVPYQNKGYSLYLLDRNEEALTVYEQAIKLAPQDAYTYTVKGDVLRELKRYEEALSAYERAIQLNPRDTYTIEAKGEILKVLSHPETAKHANEVKS